MKPGIFSQARTRASAGFWRSCSEWAWDISGWVRQPPPSQAGEPTDQAGKGAGKGKNTKDALYILDEPTTGLSYSDSERLLQLLDELVQQGASVLITEHDSYILSSCDYLIEMGPGGGTEGGRVIAQGTPAELRDNPASIIGKYLDAPGKEGGLP